MLENSQKDGREGYEDNIFLVGALKVVCVKNVFILFVFSKFSIASLFNIYNENFFS